MKMIYLHAALLATLLLSTSCVQETSQLTVEQYHLRERMFSENENQMAHGEVQRFLHGSISIAERKQKIGEYYHITWDKAPAEALQVVFAYQQAATGSKIIRETRKIQGPKINEYFAVAGESYQKKGRVLAWKFSVLKNGKELASKQSYMWQ